jgi:flagellar biosynthesis protein FlhB
MSEKPLPPTPKRLHDARAEGNVARSDALTGFAVALVAVEVGFLCADAGFDRWLRLQDAVFAQLQSGDPVDMRAWLPLLRHVAYFAAITLVPITACCLIASVAASWALGTLTFAPKSIKPSLKRLNPARHVKGQFSATNLMAVVLALAAAGIVGAAAYWRLREQLPIALAMIAWQSPTFDRHAGVASLHVFARTLFAALIGPVVLSAIIAIRQHRKGLRMSHRELRDELKQTSGDPLIRAQQRAWQTEAATAAVDPGRKRTGNRTGKRALVTNPEHIAVLLDYSGDDTEPPVVVDKALDDDALQMANSALLERVPVFRFRRLARHLYCHGELQATIPPDCYRAVAIVYRIVEEIEQLDERPSAPIDIDDIVFDE